MTATDLDTGLWDALADLDAARAQLAEVTRERDAARAAYLDASEAADLASAARLDYWADGYRAGYGAGAEVGHGHAAYIAARCAESHDPGWQEMTGPPPVAGFADLDARRYPSHDGRPAGRAGWLTRNLGGTWAAWAARCADDDSEGGQ